MAHHIAMVFPGQGSQSVGMMQELFAAFSLVQELFSEASDVLGYDLWQLCSNNPDNRLQETEYTQPALLAASYAAWRVYLSEGGSKPLYLAGHSLGEYTAFLCAESLSFADALRLVAKRGAFMQKAVPVGTGSMAAILGLSDEVVKELCAQAAKGACVSAANFNSPGQVVIAGETAAVMRAMELAKEQGAKLVKQLPVSVPSHCALMQSAAVELADYLSTLPVSLPVIPVIHNVDLSVSDSVAEIRDKLIRQLTCPVQWVGTIERLKSLSVNTVIECGPGKVLTGLNKRIDNSLMLTAYSDPDSLSNVLTLK